MEEKCGALTDFQSTRLIALKNSQQIKFQLYHSNNKKKLEAVKTLQEKLLDFEKELMDYQTSLEFWQSEMNEVGTIDPSRESNIGKISENITALEELEEQLPRRPPSLLPLIADAYQNSGDDGEAFISRLRSILDAPTTPSFVEAAKLLKNGEVWTIADKPSAAAVRHLLCNTSIRPKSVEMTYTDLPEQMMEDIRGFFSSNKLYKMDVKVELNCFHHSEELSTKTEAATTAKLAVLLTPPGWATLTQFLGRLDAATVQKLPATIKSVGLVLRDQEDMAAVNALCGAAFGTGKYRNHRDRLQWKSWTDLNLAVAKTFRPEHWNLTWWWNAAVIGGWRKTPLSLPSTLSALSVRLRLHLPQLLPGDRRWMADLFGGMGLTRSRFSNPGPMLLLPGACINPDFLLGVLRDSGQRWEVHFPTSLPKLVPRGEVAKQYRGYGHSITWDLE